MPMMMRQQKIDATASGKPVGEKDSDETSKRPPGQKRNRAASTRVDVTLSRQNQALLESMNRRSEAQLRLQQTVEGPSVAAITYYIVSLPGYLAKGLKGVGLPIDTELAMAIGIPIVAAVVALGVRRIRHHVTREAP
jgi:uncharacterized membrane-anchored protein